MVIRNRRSRCTFGLPSAWSAGKIRKFYDRFCPRKERFVPSASFPGSTSLDRFCRPRLKVLSRKTKQLSTLYTSDKAANDSPIILCVDTIRVPGWLSLARDTDRKQTEKFPKILLFVSSYGEPFFLTNLLFARKHREVEPM